jgi:hypothetical protein
MKTDTITVEAVNAVYTGAAINANIATTASGITPTYTYYNGTTCSGTALSGAPINVGNYSVKVSVAGNSDYEPANTCVTLTITKKTDVLSITKASKTYDGEVLGATITSESNKKTSQRTEQMAKTFWEFSFDGEEWYIMKPNPVISLKISKFKGKQ